MLRYLRYLILLAVMVVLVVVALANRQLVTVQLMPPGLDFIFQWGVEGVPLFAVILGSMLIGFLLGELFEYFRERKIRRVSSQRRRELTRLEQENAELKKRTGQGEDEVLAILN